ncbi:hypothetical protein [Aliivibrio fischeri]|uniref:Uncharacterized protein n=1 Tax=Aliivibrio fischeri SR5 TaxID=1088719 RepID=A0AAV3EVR5_ALIFS|nr:hypothetical protein [Aliivibrio fischeri]EHN70923.1 hypothetical protein VFSR5_0703 [Aliivibrio fischeri SR5]
MEHGFDIENAESAITIDDGSNETTYDNLYVTRIEPNDPRVRKLVLDYQGRSDGWTVGLNRDQPIVVSLGLRAIENDLKNALDAAFEYGHRISINLADTQSLAQISAQKGMISTPPKNRIIEPTEGQYDYSLVMEVAPKNYSEDYPS